MQYIDHYRSPLGMMTMSSDGDALTGLWFDGQKYCKKYSEPGCKRLYLPIFETAKQWLDMYFEGKDPCFTVPMQLCGTAFQKEVWRVLLSIPYGKTVTYGEVARLMTKSYGSSGMFARAVGGAVGRNRIAVMVPCHRVLGADGSLTGYAGGTDRKTALLRIENISLPQNSNTQR